MSAPFVTLNASTPHTDHSWWTLGISREEQAAWFQRAADQLERMAGSPEARNLGYRYAVDERRKVA